MTASSEHSSSRLSQSAPANCQTSATVSMRGSSFLASMIVRQSNEWIIARCSSSLRSIASTSFRVKTSWGTVSWTRGLIFVSMLKRTR
jgi:hypothetical protein